jgi:hypothetical protein
MHQTLRRADLPYRNPKGTKTKQKPARKAPKAGIHAFKSPN